MTQQGTDQWFADRLGKVTASRIADVMMKPTTAGFQNYRSQLVCERLTGQPTESHTSAAMQHGIDTEPQARATYTLETGLTVEETGFVLHPEIAMSGASPDGLVEADGLVEIKCAQPTEHIRMLTGGDPKRNYILQMQWQMECTGRKWCDLAHFCPNLPDDLQLHILRVQSDPDLQSDIRAAVSSFLEGVDHLIEQLESRLEAAA